jgi:hypothetical protein
MILWVLVKQIFWRSFIMAILNLLGRTAAGTNVDETAALNAFDAIPELPDRTLLSTGVELETRRVFLANRASGSSWHNTFSGLTNAQKEFFTQLTFAELDVIGALQISSLVERFDELHNPILAVEAVGVAYFNELAVAPIAALNVFMPLTVSGRVLEVDTNAATRLAALIAVVGAVPNARNTLVGNRFAETYFDVLVQAEIAKVAVPAAQAAFAGGQVLNAGNPAAGRLAALGDANGLGLGADVVADLAAINAGPAAMADANEDAFFQASLVTERARLGIAAYVGNAANVLQLRERLLNAQQQLDIRAQTGEDVKALRVQLDNQMPSQTLIISETVRRVVDQQDATVVKQIEQLPAATKAEIERAVYMRAFSSF